MGQQRVATIRLLLSSSTAGCCNNLHRGVQSGTSPTWLLQRASQLAVKWVVFSHTR
jgi:hypothetical protein